MPLPDLIVFDLGGTTIQDRGEVLDAFSTALQTTGLTVDNAAIGAYRGASKREVLRHLLAEQRPELVPGDREKLAATTYQRFRSTLVERLRATRDLGMPDAVPVYGQLKQAGARLALNSGFDRSILETILAVVAWPDGVFDAVVCADDVPMGRPAPFMIFRSMEMAGVTDVRRVAVVGDTALDLEAGANAGVVYRIGVLTGAHDRASLERAPYTHVLDSLGALPALWLDA